MHTCVTFKGKGASRRLRRLNALVPAIIYGGDKAPANISVPHRDLVKQLENEAFYSHHYSERVWHARTGGIKGLQRHPAKPLILHADFLRVSATKKLHVNVPLHFINEDSSKGVKTGGGVVSHSMSQLEILCLPADRPSTSPLTWPM